MEPQPTIVFAAPAPSTPPPLHPGVGVAPIPAQPVANPLRTPASIIVRKDQSHKTAAKTKKSIHVLSRMDITREMMTINQVISGIHLVDSLQRPVNPQLAFQVQGTHWVLPIDSEVQKFAEEDIYLIIFDVFYNAGMELIQQFDQEIHSNKGMGETVFRESFLFQRLRSIPVFHTT